MSEARLTAIAEAIQARARSIAEDTRTRIEIVSTGHNRSALAATEVQSAIERAADGLGYDCQRLPSGAGHDAQMAATLCPMGMIFVPSVGGVSHSPKELTAWEDCARGADVLLHTILAMDRT